MTQEASHTHHGHGNIDLEADILAALWEEVPFPRLPLDAPAELQELVVEIENPRRVYTIHRAVRRHSLQQLLEKFIYQLRYGCGYNDCTTPSCFTCRRRLAGKNPIRRYSPTSARTLAVYLASQDNPELQLCPNLHSISEPSDAVKPLIFGVKSHPSRHEPNDNLKAKKPNGHISQFPPKQKINHATQSTSSRKPPRPSSQSQEPRNGTNEISKMQMNEAESTSPSTSDLEVYITERPTRRDYRSFAANVFGTVAFKMLEWLAPNNINEMSNKAAAALDGSRASRHADTSGAEEDGEGGLFVPPAPSTSEPDGPGSRVNEGDGQESTQQSTYRDSQANGVVSSNIKKSAENRPTPMESNVSGRIRPSKSRKNSRTRVRTPSLSKPLPSADYFSDVNQNDHGPVSPRNSTDLSSKAFLRANSKRSQTITLTNGIEKSPSGPANMQGGELHNNYNRVTDELSEETSSVDESVASLGPPHDTLEPKLSGEPDAANSIEDILPQSLSRLDTRSVDFICDVLQEDHTCESHLLEPQAVHGSKSHRRQLKSLKRKGLQQPYAQNLRLEWKLFIEQSIFSILSDPYAILESFTGSGGLIDSTTIWYRMLRLTRVAPSLVFDSLWMASASLFAPPKALRSARSPTASFLPRSTQSLTNEQAGFVLSISFHALVAAAPVVKDSAQLFDMSRIRSRGLTLAESGAVAQQPSSLCLEYEDAFTDDMALRLARRLLAAIPTRRYFDDLMQRDLDSEDGARDSDVLEVLLSHLEPGRENDTPLEFSYTERELHEKRVPILLLDWIRTVMLNDWQGKPEVPGDGPFGGAMSLLAAMYEKRKSLHLADVAFRSEYFGDRLDAIEMPISWLTFTPTKQKAHLLDYPYIFHPSSLVTYFRAVNFSRMSRAYEESSSLQSRISAIISTDSLVTDEHQKGVLQDLLKTASSKFLILDIGRKTVINDAFTQLWRRQERELLRPLKVHLGEDSGEEGFDSGGVQQEFFRLAVAEALDPDYGAFTVDSRTRMTWFQPGSLQPEWKFELTGLLVSLGVFNGLTLPVTFPKALYRKLLGEPVNELHHIADGWPDLANGLTTLLEWDEQNGAIEDVFARTYEFSIDMFGQPVSRQMDLPESTPWPQFPRSSSADPLTAGNPEDAPLVTADNRNAYVSDYIRYLTDVSIAPQYEAFARGFRACLHPKALQLLTAPLLQSLIEGNQEIDIAELRRATRYVGWDASHRTVRDFWSIVKRYDERMKKKLLEFVTASDRVPVGGIGNVQFVVQRNGEEEGEGGHLPTAYTCYGTLLLPEYRDREVLRERLGMALENAQGFGFA
ncbi:hypothetical protein BX600DRAFT_397602 [Xylariales sp. PMI_506]|nr:hypothetical protein BX600DRAFT_397602 [Xylariales sp. PMI_506]